MKQVSSQVVRSRYRQITKKWAQGWQMFQGADMEDDDPDYYFHLDPEYPDRRKLFNVYDIADYKSQDHVKGYRK